MDPTDNRANMTSISRLHVPLGWPCPQSRVSAVTQIFIITQILYCLNLSCKRVEQFSDSLCIHCDAVLVHCRRIDELQPSAWHNVD